VLYLIDSSIYVFRGWQSFPKTLTNTRGEAFNAVTGFTTMIAALVSNEQPQAITAAFDSRNRQAIRYRIHPEYKANRSPSPPELASQFSQCQAVCQAFGISTLINEEVEADDLIGHLSNLAHDEQRPVTIISADKDLVQFIGKCDIFWDYARNTRSTYAQLSKRFGVAPEQIADLLALCGDKTDNIPGIPGVGAATAARVLSKWGTLDKVFANIDGIANMRFRGAAHVATLLAAHEDTVRLARQLTGLVTTKDLPSTLESARYTAPTMNACIDALVTIGFSEEDATSFARDACLTNSPVK